MSNDKLVIGEISRTATSTVFDRRQEREADEFAIELLDNAEINPRIIATFFRRLKEEEGTYNENLEILMTHPHINSRIKASLEYNLDEDFVSEEFNLNWDLIKNF